MVKGRWGWSNHRLSWISSVDTMTIVSSKRLPESLWLWPFLVPYRHDLSPLGYFLLSHVKDHVYRDLKAKSKEQRRNENSDSNYDKVFSNRPSQFRQRISNRDFASLSAEMSNIFINSSFNFLYSHVYIAKFRNNFFFI